MGLVKSVYFISLNSLFFQIYALFNMPNSLSIKQAHTRQQFEGEGDPEHSQAMTGQPLWSS